MNQYIEAMLEAGCELRVPLPVVSRVSGQHHRVVDDAQRGRVPPDAMALVLDPLQLAKEAVGGGVGVDPVGETSGPSERRLGAATDQDLDGRRWGGPDR